MANLGAIIFTSSLLLGVGPCPSIRTEWPDDLVAAFLSATDVTQPLVPALPEYDGGCFWPFVNTFTGNLHASYRVVAVPAVGCPWDFRLYYNSVRTNEATAFGLGWRHSYDLRVVVSPDSSTITLTWGDGRTDLFTRSGAVWIAGPSLEGRQIAPIAGGLELTTKHQLKYRFNPQGRLTAIVDRNGNAMTYAYDGLDRLVTIADASGRSLTLGYNAQNLVNQVSGFISQPIQFTYTGNLLEDIVDPQGFPYHYQYDGLSRLVRAEDGQARSIEFFYYLTEPYVVSRVTAANAVRRYDYDGLNRRTAVRDSISAGVESSTRYRYDAVGRCIEVEDDELMTAASTYDPLTNKLASHTDADGRVTSYTHDALGNLLTATFADGSQIAYTYDPVYNFPLTYQRRSGGVTTYTYDGLGNCLTQTNPLGGQAVYTYTALGEMASYQDERGFTTRYQYDANGNMTRVTNPTGDAREATYDIEGALLTVKDRTNNTWTFTRNARLEAVTIAEPTGGNHQMSYTPSGRLASRQDPTGATTIYTYDALDRVIRTQMPTGGIHTLVRDGAGRVIEEQDAIGRVMRYVRDTVGRITSRIHPGGQSWQFGWGACDLLSMIDASGTLNSYQYDGMHRRIQAATPGVTHTYAYDTASRLVTARTLYPPNPAIEYNYGYDAMDRRISEIQQPLNRSVSWTRNLYGDVEVASDNLRPGTATWAYNSRELTSSVGTTLPAFNASIFYDQECRVRQMNYTNGVNALYTYDASGRMSTMRDQSPSYTATYDPIVRNLRGDVIHIDINTPAVPGPTPYDIGYDPNGNVLTEMLLPGIPRTYQYDARDNRTFKNGPAGAEPYILSPDHWITGAGALVQAWNVNGEMINSTRPGRVVNYTYRSDRAIDQIAVNGQVYRYLIGPFGEIAWMRAPSGVESWFGYDYAGDGIRRRSVHSAINVAPREEFLCVKDDLKDIGTASTFALSLKSPFVPVNRSAILHGPMGVSRVTNGNGVILGSKDFTSFGEVLGQTGVGQLPTFGGMDHLIDTELLQLGLSSVGPVIAPLGMDADTNNDGNPDELHYRSVPDPLPDWAPLNPTTGGFSVDGGFGPDVMAGFLCMGGPLTVPGYGFDPDPIPTPPEAGGTFSSPLPVRPHFTFSTFGTLQSHDTTVKRLDTGDPFFRDPLPPSEPAPFVGPLPPVVVDPDPWWGAPYYGDYFRWQRDNTF